jgi:FkbM family methyltransferase
VKFTQNDIKFSYEFLLGRLPENDQAIELHRKNSTYESLFKAITESDEYRSRLTKSADTQMVKGDSPFWHYNSEIDAVRIVRSHENKERVAVAGHSVNYLGVAVNVDRFFPGFGFSNGLESLPLPSNWHADLSEFAAALRAVEISGKSFTMIELGCGWGCWMNNTGMAARKLGKKINLIGVEGDEDHVNFAHEAMATNKFSKNEYRILRGIAGVKSGFALFPKQKLGGTSWGSEPIFNASVKEEAKLTKNGEFVRIPVLSLGDIAANESRIDLLHIDIQGGEADFLAGSLGTLWKK